MKKIVKHFCLSVFALSLLSAKSSAHEGGQPDSSSTTIRTVTEVAKGVYMIRHPDAPDAFPQGNTTVIIGEKAVLVVDACYLPSSATEDIADIRKWTNKPVRYLINTHWHYDHTMGNGIYAKEFPGIDIIAHTETRKRMEGYNPGWFRRYPSRVSAFQKIVDSGKDNDGNALSESDLKEYKAAIDGIAPVQKEFEKLEDVTPNVSFDSGIDIDLGGRAVQVRHLGRGNTAGDAVVYLPAEKIIIAGDLLDHPVPYLGGGYPLELISTLKKMAGYDFEKIIPGHGNLLVGKTYLEQVTGFITAVTDAVDQEIFRIGNDSRKLDQVQEGVSKRIDLEGWRKKFAGENKPDQSFFDSFSYPGLVKAAYAEMWRR